MAIKGQFADTGDSASIAIQDQGRLVMNFGTGTVELRVQDAHGNWVTSDTFTADADKIVDGGNATYKLTCTAYTATISYSMWERGFPMADTD